jgi:hypothetical protein
MGGTVDWNEAPPQDVMIFGDTSTVLYDRNALVMVMARSSAFGGENFPFS